MRYAIIFLEKLVRSTKHKTNEDFLSVIEKNVVILCVKNEITYTFNSKQQI